MFLSCLLSYWIGIEKSYIGLMSAWRDTAFVRLWSFEIPIDRHSLADHCFAVVQIIIYRFDLLT